ncbi:MULTISPECIES: DUF6603 domain-containing protein [Pseudomonas]|uniref:DUF6603 domain-containing protein n=1 Tax=Pseudomonas asplenii TaxID=53407 RepID=A0A0N0E1W1_9PSED|nr:DUF6603 domain-containing protein [Pseudomonas fuscovaginae]KPA88149.1 hypothetical protein PF66_05381 [Pseudomonas fuscovaginae]KPA98338.1 hypothetical protein PF70_01548 [Pseudomonas fuscovaginae]
MDINQLASDLRKQATDDGKLVLDKRLLSDEQVAQIAVAFLLDKDAALIVEGVQGSDIIGPDAGVVRVTSGTGALFKVKDVGLQLSFSIDGDKVAVLIEASLPSGWDFASSWPAMTFFPFNLLKPANPRLVYTSLAQAAFRWSKEDASTIGLAQGQNFLSTIGLQNIAGVGAILGDLVGTSAYKFYGPFAPVSDAPYPVGRISAPVSDAVFAIGIGDWALSLSAPAVGVSISAPDDSPQQIGFAVSSLFNGKLDCGVEISQGLDSLVIFAQPAPGAQFNASDMIRSLPGGQHYDDYIPQALSQVFENISLTRYRMVLVNKSAPVSSVTLGIHTRNPWTLISNVLTLESLTLLIRLIAPTGPKAETSVEITATAQFLPTLFNTSFDFTLSLAKQANAWNIEQISGQMTESVSLEHIVKGVVGASVPVPAALGEIVFDSFGMTVTGDQGTYAYTVFGSVRTAFTLLDTSVDAQLSVLFKKTGADASVALSGSFLVGQQNFSFELKFDAGTQPGVKLQAHWQAEDNDYLQFADIASALGFSIPAIPPELDLALSQASFVYDMGNNTVLLSATSAHYGTGTFVALKTLDPKTQASTSNYVFQMLLGFEVSLADLPLVGKIFTDDRLGSIRNVQALFAASPLSADEVKTLNAMLTQAKVPAQLPLPKDAKGTTIAIAAGFNFSADIELGGVALPLAAGGDTAPVNTQTAPAVAARPPTGNAAWLTVGKSIGPVSLARIGVRYEDGRVWLLIDAGFSLAMLSFDLQGLGLGFRIPDSKGGDLGVAAQLDGMSLALQAGPLSIAGGFLRFDNDFLGEARVSVATFSLTAIGGYAPDESSFFIFVRLQQPLGGPPFFFVTGLAGGFGINRSLLLPTIDQLTSYPLLPQNNKRPENSFPTTLGTSNPGQVLQQTLVKTQSYIHPQAGEYWVAAGIDFTSFEMVDATALLTVSFGVSLEVALLGICRVTVPKGAPKPIVYLEVALEARFESSSGLIAVDGRLTPASFIYAGLCHVSGGFAFYTWYAGEHAGEFLVSIGGYSPRFKKPDYFPTVPRLQMVYETGPLVLKGECYFALLSHTLMAGFNVQATWESGPISAWFSVGVDFLLGWRPFHYEADAYIHLGASFKANLLFVTVRITIHVGVELSVWGPEFGGVATVDLDIISFSVRFGSDRAQPDPVSWEDFKTSFLPAANGATRQQGLQARSNADKAAGAQPAQLVMGMVQQGLISDLKAKDSAAFFDWVLDPNHFALASSLVIPSKTARFNDFKVNTPFTPTGAFTYVGSGTAPDGPSAYGARDDAGWADDFGVLPMALDSADFSVDHQLQLTRLPAGEDYTKPENYRLPVNEVAVGIVLQNAQAALWAGTDPGLNGTRMIADTLSGLQLLPMIRHPAITADADLWALLFDTTKKMLWLLDTPTIATEDNFAATLSEQGTVLSYERAGNPVRNVDFELADLAAAAVVAERGKMVDSLNALGFSFDSAALDVSRLASFPLWDWPMIRVLGEETSAI